MYVAITREVSSSIDQCELTHFARTPIDVDLARRQHLQYEEALARLGLEVITLPEQPDFPDAVFVEDTAIVFDEVAVITRPGAESRRTEVESVRAALEPYRSVCIVTEPATLDGGDVLVVGKNVYVGLSGRSNAASVAQLAVFLVDFGYRVQGVEVTGCLHLKSAVTRVAENTLLVNPAWIDPSIFAEYDLIEVDPTEPYAANALYINGAIIYPTSFPKTRRILEERGIQVVPVDASEVQKAEGAVTCCSLVFSRRE